MPTISPQQFQALYGSGQPAAAPAANPSGIPTPTTSVGPGGNQPFQSSLPAIPQPPSQLALPNPAPNIITAASSYQNPPPPVAQSPTSPTTLSAAQFQAQYGNLAPTGPSGPTGSSGGGISQGLANFAKDIFGAPATLLARPVQAAAEVLGATAGAVDTTTNNIENAVAGGLQKIPLIGNTLADTAKGLVAPVDQNADDVVKDVGRGAETVALGLGAGEAGVDAAGAAAKGAIGASPITTGALFGGGASVANGDSIPQVITNTALGAVGGKLLDLVGTPLLNAAGKVVGTITPQIVKDVASGGADAVANFMAQHEIPLVGGVTKPLSEAIQTTAAGIDQGINKGASNLFNGAKSVVGSQFPGFDPAAHYVAINQKDIVRPTVTNEPRFAAATRIFNNAKSAGIDLGDQATKLGIQHDQLAEGNRYNTADIVDNIRDGNYQVSNDVVRPAIQQVQHGVPRTSTADVQASIQNKIDSIPASQITPEDRAYMKTKTAAQFKPGSASDLAHPQGYNLEDLHDSRISSQQNGKFKKDGTPTENLPARLARIQGSTFSDLFDAKAPAELQGVRGELEKNFKLANYLEALHGKTVPQGITQKAVRLFGRAVGGMVGSHVGGFPGFLFGSRGGDMLFNAFETLPNPIKASVLRTAFANKAEPEVYQALAQHLGQQEAERVMRLALPAAGGSSAPPATSPTLFSTPGGQAAPDLQNALDISGSRVATPPTTNTRSPAYKLKVLAAQSNQGPYVAPRNLPVIDAGKRTPLTKSLNDIKF